MSGPGNLEVVVGAILGETYEVTRVLGEGGMGAVWEANHLRLPGKRFAVKVMHGHASADREAYARFRREAEIASRIGHPNIIEVLDWNTLPSGAPYLVLEYLEGEDLASRISRGKLPLDQALSIARQIGSALKAAHAADVVHRDLKPGNVFLVPREVDGVIISHVKVLDFGISKIRNSQTVQTQDAVLLGTPQYMAPEQALGKNNEIDARTDVFALGAIVYEMLTGEPPFVGTTLAEVVFKVVYEPVPKLSALVPDVPPEIEAAVERAMSKAAADRFPDVSSFVQALTGRGLATSDRRAIGTSAQVPAAGSAKDRTAVDPLTVDRPASPFRGKWLFLAAAIVVGGGGTIAAVKLLGDKPPVAVAPRVIVTPVEAPKVDAAVAKPADMNPVDTKIVEAKPVDAKPAAQKDATARPHDSKPEVISPAAEQVLNEAQAAYDQGDTTEAIRLATKSQLAQTTSRSFAILTLSYCRGNNLGTARGFLHRVAARDRAQVIKKCKGYGVDPSL